MHFISNISARHSTDSHACSLVNAKFDKLLLTKFRKISLIGIFMYFHFNVTKSVVEMSRYNETQYERNNRLKILCQDRCNT